MYWEDNPYNKNYNMLNLNNKSNERLFRKDNIYDILVVIKYNVKPIIPGKGSAIFIHIAKRNYFPTKGCIALDKKDLIFLINKLSMNEEILIGY
jgi:L,D-peptidoglycan transpeptidase YkuD (ErfK/YbiS/YcfS/YnhG family)